MAEQRARRWASIYAKGDFVCFQTFSGLRSCAMDSAGKTLFTKPDDPVSQVGQALLDALSVSRVLRSEEIATFFDLKASAQRYELWVSVLMQHFGIASRRALFKDMKSCSVDQADGVITLRPMRHQKLEGWSGDGIDKSAYVQLDEASSPMVIGQGVLLALSRCIA